MVGLRQMQSMNCTFQGRCITDKRLLAQPYIFEIKNE